MKYFIKILTSDCECAQNRQSYTYTTTITVLNMNIQGYNLLTTRPQYNKLFCKFSYQRCTASVCQYMILLKMRTTSYWPPSLLKYLRNSMKTGSPLGQPSLAKGICEVNTLTLKTYNTLQNQHLPHHVTLNHQRIHVLGSRRQSIL